MLDAPQKSASGRRRTAHDSFNKYIAKMIKAGKKPFEAPYCIDLDASDGRVHLMHDQLKCLTRGRVHGFWITNRGRRMTVRDLMKAQGIMPDTIVMHDRVSDYQYGQMAGNTMYGNVLKAVFGQVFKALGWPQ